MKWIKLFEDFKQNNEEGSLITLDDIIKCIKGEGVVYATAVKDLPSPGRGLVTIKDLIGFSLLALNIEVLIRNLSKFSLVKGMEVKLSYI